MIRQSGLTDDRNLDVSSSFVRVVRVLVDCGSDSPESEHDLGK
jgi:hypothetical protein